MRLCVVYLNKSIVETLKKDIWRAIKVRNSISGDKEAKNTSLSQNH